jgi:tRNA A37 threonylcarbamoyladenosine dehydratase
MLGETAVKRLENARVAVFGIGGVGGMTAEALVRSGIGALDLFDHDTVSVTNLNRQIFATHQTVGMQKVDAAAERLLSINPELKLTLHPVFFMPENAEEFDFSIYDYIVDAIDTVSGKIAIVLKAQEQGVPVISAMGAGNKIEASAFRVADIYQTSVCPLAKVMRKELKNRGVKKLKVVYSEELPFAVVETDEEGRRIPASVAFVPTAAGLVLAGEVVKDLIGDRTK